MNLNEKRVAKMVMLAGAAAVCVSVSTASAQVNAVWTGASNGTYSTANRWTPVGVPNGNFNAIINAAGAYSVRVDNNYGVRGLSVAVSSVAVEIQPGFTFAASTSIANNGNIIVNNTATNADTNLGIGGSLPLSGTGFITLNSFGSNAARAKIISSDPAFTLTQGPDHTIRGTGTILMAMNNTGTVHADRAQMMVIDNAASSVPSANSGLIKATGLGGLQINDTVLVQSGVGTVLSDGSTVQIRGSRVVNGRINSTNSGVIEFDSVLGDSSIGGTQSMNADARILSGATLGLRTGTLTNSGSLKVNDAAGNSATTLTLENGSMTLTGSGEVWLNGVATNLATAQITAADAAYVLTNDTNHTIRGIGTVTAAFTNLGTIRADGTGAILTLESTAVSTNSGTISAPTGTTLRVANMQLNQSGGVVLADAGSAKVRGSSIYGGNVHAQNGGTVDYVTTTSGNPLLSNVNLSGNQYVLPGTTLMANTAITNNSTLRVGDGTSSDPASIEMDTLNVTLGGTGTVQLRDSNLGPDTASIHASQTTSVLTNGVNHTIRGNGEINVFNIVNRGQIIADVNDRTLDIYIDDITNHGLLQATAGGSLNLGNCTLVQVGSGEVLVENNSDVVMPDSIDGGSVRATGTGRIRIINDLDILSGVTFVGEVSLSNSTVGWINTISVGTPTTVTNQGKIIVGDAPGTQPCEIRLTQSGPSFFNGQGAIILDTAIPEAIGNAKLVSSVAGAILVNRTNHTIRGRGVVDVEVSNEGTIAPGLVDIDFGIGELNFGNVELDLEPSSRLRIEIAGNTLFDKISGNADVICDGEMFVNLVNGYQPTAGQEFRIIRGTTRTGTFDTVHLPTLNDSSLKWLVSYVPAGVTLKVVCGADFNSDGVVDFFDYLDFVAEFSGATVSADFNNDAVIDFFDYLDFVAAFSGGC